MGEVYRARDTRLGREVAAKVLPEPLADSDELRERFEREARRESCTTAETFGVSPDGRRVIVAGRQVQSSILPADGVAGLAR